MDGIVRLFEAENCELETIIAELTRQQHDSYKQLTAEIPQNEEPVEEDSRLKNIVVMTRETKSKRMSQLDKSQVPLKTSRHSLNGFNFD